MKMVNNEELPLKVMKKISPQKSTLNPLANA
jgi:hypothetical protein